MPAPDLYNKILIDHYKSTEHRGVPDSFTHSGSGYNHNCGDEITVYLTVRGELIEDASFEGKGCMICQASASIMTGELKGKSVVKALQSISHLNQLMKGEAEGEVKVKVKVEVEKGNVFDGKADVEKGTEIEGKAEVDTVSDVVDEAGFETVTKLQIETEARSEVETGPEAETAKPDYIALSGIREFPMRIKCATLAWDTAAKLLQSSGSEITSE